MAAKETKTGQDAVPVEGLEVKGGKVVAVPAEPEVTPPPAQPKPEQAAKPGSADEEVTANIGHVRVRTTAEKRVQAESGNKEANTLRDAKEAHRDAARLSVAVQMGTEFQTADIEGENTRVRLLFDWFDGQGVAHERGKELDLPPNEASKLVYEGRAERANPPAADPVEQAMNEAKMGIFK